MFTASATSSVSFRTDVDTGESVDSADADRGSRNCPRSCTLSKIALFSTGVLYTSPGVVPSISNAG